MNTADDELARLFDESVARLATCRRTFTDEEALQSIWEQGYDISPQSDPQGRFALASEAHGRHRRQWRLSTQTLANDRLLDALRSGAWNGRDLDAELARLDIEDQAHYVFCPTDPRFTQHPDGAWEPADREYSVTLPPETQAALDALGPALLKAWHSEGAAPLTLRQLTERLDSLGWTEATARNAWLMVRAWLLNWPEVARVGQDYWVPANSIPKQPKRTRLQVLPMLRELTSGEEPAEQVATGESGVVREAPPAIDSGLLLQQNETLSNRVSWTYPLRMIHILEGFIPVPAKARCAYPPRGAGEGDREALRGLWYDEDERLWLWLDRAQDRLYGPDLARKLEWLEAGDLLNIQWTPEVIVLRVAGLDNAVQCEEERLVDPQALKALRGGLGESYRQSIQAILSAKAGGLTFAQVVHELRARQGHDVPRSTVRAILYAGGFVHRDGRWFAAPEEVSGKRRLRAVLAETLVPVEESEQIQTAEAEVIDETERLRRRVQAIRARLAEIVTKLRGGL